MHLSCCLLIVCVFTTISMMESTTSTPLFININSLFNIEKDNEFASQTQINNGSQEAYNLQVDASWELFTQQLLANQDMWYPFHCFVDY